MFDINAIINAAITAAVTEATKPLLARIEALENAPTDLQRFDDELAHLTGRLNALEDKPAVQVDEAKMVEALNSLEWFWEKVRGFVDAGVESAMDDHTTSYDHDQYDEVYNEWGGEDPDDFVKDGYLDDQIVEKVNDVLRNASFSISI